MKESCPSPILHNLLRRGLIITLKKYTISSNVKILLQILVKVQNTDILLSRRLLDYSKPYFSEDKMNQVFTRDN